ncbi:MAG TPA: hypothetical protein VK014_00995 [Cyclobacteriaceae bacterium]|nr:hypothetical protein [Cyclobacteriaceae bacterium]
MESIPFKNIVCILMLCVSPFLIIGCTGEEDEEPTREGEYFLKFKANGIEKRYEALPNSNASFFYLPDYKIYGGAIMGVKNIQQATKDVVSIQLFNETTYETNKTYQLQDAVSVDLFTRSRIIFTYMDENGKSYNAALLRQNYPTLTIKDEAEVRFDELASNYVRGTFSALVLETDATNRLVREELVITDGEFYLPRMDGAAPQ